MISVLCPCGNRLHAKEEMVGRRAKCPECGAVVTIEPEAVLEDPPQREKVPFHAITVDIGQINTPSGLLSMSIKVTCQGKAFVMTYAREASSKRQGELLPLTLDEFFRLRKLTEQVEIALRGMSETGQIANGALEHHRCKNH